MYIICFWFVTAYMDTCGPGAPLSLERIRCDKVPHNDQCVNIFNTIGKQLALHLDMNEDPLLEVSRTITSKYGQTLRNKNSLYGYFSFRWHQ